MVIGVDLFKKNSIAGWLVGADLFLEQSNWLVLSCFI
jgi:hypothetical protein